MHQLINAKNDDDLKLLFNSLEKAEEQYHKISNNPYNIEYIDGFIDWFKLSYSILSLAFGDKEKAKLFIDQNLDTVPGDFSLLLKIYLEEHKSDNLQYLTSIDEQKQLNIMSWKNEFSAKQYCQHWAYAGHIFSELVLAHHFWKNKKYFYFKTYLNNLSNFDVFYWHRRFSTSKWILGKIFDNDFIDEVDKYLVNNMKEVCKNAGFVESPVFNKIK